MKNVHKVNAKVINLPTDQLKEDRGYKFCGKPYLTFANPEDGSVSWQNDLFSVAFIADSVEVVLEKDGTELTAFGVTLDFPNQPDAVGFMIIWREVLLNHGAGCYKVKANYVLQGIEFTLHYGSFDLMPYSVQASESTIRVLGQYNDEVKMYGINFAGSSFARTFRVKGNLHNEQPNTEHGNILKGDDKFAKYRNHGQISYDLETAPLVACELDPLFELLISSNKIYVSDFNSANFRQYRDVEVILRGDEEISYGEQFGSERQLFAPFKQKEWLVESKYSEGAGDGQIFTSGLDFDNLVCPAVVCADATFTISDSQGNLIESGSIPSGGNEDVTLPEIWWERPEGWLPMPTITALENKFAGLYAVFEDGFNAVAILLNGSSHTIDWGDGATDSGSGVVTYNHVYDYATVTGAVLVSDDGRNYKQVMIQADFDGSTNLLQLWRLTTPLTGTNARSQNFLDIICSTENTAFLFDFSRNGVEYKQRYLQRVKVLGNIARISCFENLSLKVLDYDFTQGNINGISDTLQLAGDVRRDETGTPLNYFSNNVTNAIRLASNSNISKIGNIDFPNCTNFAFIFHFCRNMESIGNINAPLNTTFSGAIDNCRPLKSLGVITVGTALTRIDFMFRDNFLVPTIIFAGDMSGVTNTTNAFLNTHTLQRLILPNITVGFDIRASQVTGDNLQDLQDSVGTADGVQTITLPLFVDGEDVSTFISKGYTIAYA